MLYPTNKSSATKEHQLRLTYTDRFPKIGKKDDITGIAEKNWGGRTLKRL
jgi:hypothetical protein